MALSLEDLVSQAGFIFDGTVQRVGATTSSALAPAPDMAVVRVMKIVKSPPALARFTGQDITVQHAATMQPGERALFFAVGLHFGDGLAVREIGRTPVVGPTAEADVHAAIEKRSDHLLAARLRDALLVVEGVAVRTEQWKPPPRTPQRVSEHDPDWWECAIKVRKIEKGEHKHAKGSEVVTLFAKSTDILWYQSPKFSPGDEGIWLLHGKDLRGRDVPASVSDHPLDFHPLSQGHRIRSLLERPHA